MTDPGSAVTLQVSDDGKVLKPYTPKSDAGRRVVALDDHNRERASAAGRRGPAHLRLASPRAYRRLTAVTASNTRS
jgi:hypothetical protein